MSQDEKNKLKNYVLWLLARQEYSTKELTRKLKDKGADDDYIDVLLDWCKSKGYLDDMRYCESFIRQQVNKGLGLKRVIAEVSKKGLDKTYILQLIDEQEVDWYQIAQNTYQKKYSYHESSLEYKEKAKRIRYMMYRGFSYEEIEFAMQAATIGE
jgi:regulatory protein